MDSSFLFEMDGYVHHLFNRAVVRSCTDEFLAFHDEVTYYYIFFADLRNIAALQS